MAVESNKLNQKIAFISVAFGAIGLALVCVGIGTPNWQSTYQYTSGSAQVASTNNFFSNGSLQECLNRNKNLTYFDSPFTGFYTAANDTSTRLQNAAALSIVGIIFLALSTIFTLMMAIVTLNACVALIPPILLFLACLFILAGLAEGARVIVLNDCPDRSNLYLTTLCLQNDITFAL